jgi:hypothetical protein
MQPYLFERLLASDVEFFIAEPEVQGAAPPVPEPLMAAAKELDGKVENVRVAIAKIDQANDRSDIEVKQIGQAIIASELREDGTILNCWNVLSFVFPMDLWNEDLWEPAGGDKWKKKGK